VKITFRRSILTLATVLAWGMLAQADDGFPAPLTNSDSRNSAPHSGPGETVSALNSVPFSTQQQPTPPVQTKIGSTPIGQSRIGLNKTTKSKSEQNSVTPPVSSGQIFVSLVFVIVLIMVTARFWKRHLPGGGATISNEVMTVLGERKVNKQHSICLVRLGSRILVLGASADGLRTLSEITDPVEIDLLAGMSKTSQDENQFSNTLYKFLKSPSQTTATLKSSTRAKTRRNNRSTSFEESAESAEPDAQEVPHV